MRHFPPLRGYYAVRNTADANLLGLPWKVKQMHAHGVRPKLVNRIIIEDCYGSTVADTPVETDNPRLRAAILRANDYAVNVMNACHKARQVCVRNKKKTWDYRVIGEIERSFSIGQNLAHAFYQINNPKGGEGKLLAPETQAFRDWWRELSSFAPEQADLLRELQEIFPYKQQMKAENGRAIEGPAAPQPMPEEIFIGRMPNELVFFIAPASNPGIELIVPRRLIGRKAADAVLGAQDEVAGRIKAGALSEGDKVRAQWEGLVMTSMNLFRKLMDEGISGKPRFLLAPDHFPKLVKILTSLGGDIKELAYAIDRAASVAEAPQATDQTYVQSARLKTLAMSIEKMKLSLSSPVDGNLAMAKMGPRKVRELCHDMEATYMVGTPLLGRVEPAASKRPARHAAKRRGGDAVLSLGFDGSQKA